MLCRMASALGGVSDELLLVAHPLAGYREIVGREPARSQLVEVALRIATNLGTLAVVGSITTAGRLVFLHCFFIALAWSFVPVLQGLVVCVMSRVCSRRLPVLRAVSLHMAGNGPYLLFLLGLAALVLLAPDVGRAFSALLDSGAIFVVALLGLLWATLTSFSFYRTCGECSFTRALVLVVAEWLLKLGLCLIWYGAIDNLVPNFTEGESSQQRVGSGSSSSFTEAR